MYITEQVGHEKCEPGTSANPRLHNCCVQNVKMKIKNKFEQLYYHKQNQNFKIPNLHLKTLKIKFNKI